MLKNDYKPLVTNMSQKENLRQQAIKLHEARDWVRNRLSEEGDRQTRDALFRASSAIGLAILNLEEVGYCTRFDEITQTMYHSEK